MVATCAALAHPTTVARHTSAIGYLEKDGAVYSPLALHGASDRDTVDPLGKMTPSTSDVCVADPWHLVGEPPTTLIDSTHCMVCLLFSSLLLSGYRRLCHSWHVACAIVCGAA